MILLACVLLAGCSDDGGPSVATAGDAPPAVAGQPTPSPSAKTERMLEEERGIQYARCMTEQGVPMDDPLDGAMPIIKHEGGAWIMGALTAELPEPLGPAWVKCKHLYPRITYRKVDAAYAQEVREYGKCMNELGIFVGVPVVEADGSISDTNDASTRSGPDPGPSADYMEAHRVCRKHLSGGEGDPPPLDQQ